MEDLSFAQAREIATQILFKTTGKYLSDVEGLVFKGAWNNMTYAEIAKEHDYSPEYLNNDVGFKLWRKLSNGLGENIKRRNLKEPLRQFWIKNHNSVSPSDMASGGTIPNLDLEFPEGLVPLSSKFYVERPDVDLLCFQEVQKSGALIRIKAPDLMGKTSLTSRILNHATTLGYQTALLNFDSCDRQKLKDANELTRWFCSMLGKQLKLENKLDQYWGDNILGSNDNCTDYLEEFILPSIDVPLVLGLDNVDRIFPYAEVIENFFGMLRSWHELGKNSDIWRQLRLVIAHSTEVYIPLDLNQSPFNAGFPVELKAFNSQQIYSLAQLHGISWTQSEVETLLNMVGGHPYLVRLALYYLAKGQMTLNQFLQEAPTEAGIYSDHLRKYLEVLENAPDLAAAYQKVVTSAEPVELDSMQIYQLHSQGLIKRRDNQVIPHCNLYREYFARVL
jgi:AAA-like domain